MNNTCSSISSKAAIRGGMCANPFGGHFRLDKLADDEFFDVEPGKGMVAAIRMTIVDAINSYLFWGLGKNGFHDPDEFLGAYDYFFSVSESPDTWPDDARTMSGWHEAIHVQKREYKTFTMTDEEMSSMTFPVQFEVAGFSRYITLKRFRRLLMEKRRQIVDVNLDQIKSYLRDVRQMAADRGHYLKPEKKATQTLLDALAAPEPESLAAFIYPQRPVEQTVHRSPFRLPMRIRGRRPVQTITVDISRTIVQDKNPP